MRSHENFVKMDEVDEVAKRGNLSPTLWDIFNEVGRKHASNVAVTFLSAKEEVESLTYLKLIEMANEVHMYMTKYSNTFIPVFSQQTVQLLGLLLGISKSRAAFAPIGLEWPPLMAAQFIKSINASVKVFAVQQQLVGQFETILTTLNESISSEAELYKEENKLLNDFIIYYKTECLKCANGLKNIAYVMQTSGTTGIPKIVKVSHQSIVPNISSLVHMFSACSSDCVALISPYTFDPFIVQLFIGLSTGARIAIIPEDAMNCPERLCEIMVDHFKVTILQPTPSLVYMLGKKLINSKLLNKSSSLRLIAFGGEQCPSRQTLKVWKQIDCKAEIFNIYGITEVSSWGTCYKITDGNLPIISEDVSDEMRELMVNSVPLGTPLEQTVIEVKDDDGKDISEGMGTIYLGGERLCYIGDEIKPETMRSTGDLGYIHQGQIWYYGRKNKQIKRMGKRINVEWIEQTLSTEIPDYTFAVVSEKSAQTLNSNIYLFVKPSDTSNVIGHKCSIQKALENCLPYFAHPDYVCFVDEIPVTSHGKVDSKKLLKDFLAKRNKRTEQSFLRQVMLLWSEATNKNLKFFSLLKGGYEEVEHVLEVNSNVENNELIVKSSDKFIENGGTSLDAIRLVNEIEQIITDDKGIEIELPGLLDIILNKTFGDLCEYIEKGLSDSIDEKALKRSNNQDYETTSHNCESKHLYPIKSLENELISNPLDDPRLNPPNKKSKIEAKLYKCFCSVQRRNCNNDCPLHSAVTNCNLPLAYHECSSYLPKINTLWKVNLHKCIDASPLAVGVESIESAKVYIGSHACIIKAIRLLDGKVLWETRLGDRIESSAAVSRCGCYIIVGCYDGNVYVINRNNGTIVWTFQTQGQVKSSPQVDHSTGLVWIGSHDHNLYVLDIESQKCIARFDCGGSCFSSPAILVSHQLVFIATLTGCVLCISTAKMVIEWRKKCPKPLFSSPLTTEDGVLCGCVDGNMYFINLYGEIKWQFKSSGPIFSSPSAFMSSIMFGCHDKCVYCVTLTGQLKWSFMADSEVYSSPFVAHKEMKSKCIDSKRMASDNIEDGVVVICSTKGTLYCLAFATGKLLLSSTFPGQLFSSPIVVDSKIIVGCRDDYLYCLDIE